MKLWSFIISVARLIVLRFGRVQKLQLLFKRCKHTAWWSSFSYLWLMVFLFIPFILVLYISFSAFCFGLPPYEKIVHIVGPLIHIKLTLQNYLFIFSDALYAVTYAKSLIIALVATLVCLVIGYPTVLAIMRFQKHLHAPLIMLMMVPFWTSSLIRVYAWMTLLSPQGIIESVCNKLGLSLAYIPSDVVVVMGIVYAYLPFMILPLYSALERLDHSLLEASFDLGCKPFKTFWFITLPLSSSGAIAGSLLVAVPAMGEFVIPELLGNGQTLMLGRLLWNEFFYNRDWPLTCAMAIVTMVTLGLPIWFMQRFVRSTP